jgi:hypothetical protein
MSTRLGFDPLPLSIARILANSGLEFHCLPDNYMYVCYTTYRCSGWRRWWFPGLSSPRFMHRKDLD